MCVEYLVGHRDYNCSLIGLYVTPYPAESYLKVFLAQSRVWPLCCVSVTFSFHVWSLWCGSVTLSFHVWSLCCVSVMFLSQIGCCALFPSRVWCVFCFRPTFWFCSVSVPRLVFALFPSHVWSLLCFRLTFDWALPPSHVWFLFRYLSNGWTRVVALAHRLHICITHQTQESIQPSTDNTLNAIQRLLL